MNFCKNNLFFKILVKSFFVKKYVRLKKDFVKKNWSLKLLVKNCLRKKNYQKFYGQEKSFMIKIKNNLIKKLFVENLVKKNLGKKLLGQIFFFWPS